jgi:hypothetical protein
MSMDPRTRARPIGSTLLRLAAPNMLVLVALAAAGLVETYFIGKLGTDALAGVVLVFPVIMLMQMMSAGAMGGGIASSIARALGGARRADADALALHALVIALGFGAAFTLGVLSGGRRMYAAMGGSGDALDAALVYSNWVFAGVVGPLFNRRRGIRGTQHGVAGGGDFGRRVTPFRLAGADFRLAPAPRHRGGARRPWSPARASARSRSPRTSGRGKAWCARRPAAGGSWSLFRDIRASAPWRRWSPSQPISPS